MNLSGKKVMITGADGFIGSHLAEMLVRRGASVRALSLYNSFNTWGWLEEIGCRNDIDVVVGDIRDAHLLKKISQDIDVIFHLAALIAIPYSYSAPDSYVQTNITGTVNVVQAALENGVDRVVHTSTSEVYGTARYVPIDENHPLQPQSPYSASKISADALALSFFHAFQLPVTIARPFNTYGPRQSARAVIPTVITQILSGIRRIKLGSLHPTRDFTYVEDTCRGLVALAESDEAVGVAVNIGSHAEISIGETVTLIKDLIGRADVTVDSESARIRPERSEVERLVCDHSKLYKLTGFRPTIDLRDGLKRTIEWFSDGKNLARYKTDIYNV
ncbi:MAG: NAD-dependent 4,6-dehydratase LegB [Nitrospirota bacterium]